MHRNTEIFNKLFFNSSSTSFSFSTGALMSCTKEDKAAQQCNPEKVMFLNGIKNIDDSYIKHSCINNNSYMNISNNMAVDLFTSFYSENNNKFSLNENNNFFKSDLNHFSFLNDFTSSVNKNIDLVSHNNSVMSIDKSSNTIRLNNSNLNNNFINLHQNNSNQSFSFCNNPNVFSTFFNSCCMYNKTNNNNNNACTYSILDSLKENNISINNSTNDCTTSNISCLPMPTSVSVSYSGKPGRPPMKKGLYICTLCGIRATAQWRYLNRAYRVCNRCFMKHRKNKSKKILECKSSNEKDENKFSNNVVLINSDEHEKDPKNSLFKNDDVVCRKKRKEKKGEEKRKNPKRKKSLTILNNNVESSSHYTDSNNLIFRLNDSNNLKTSIRYLDVTNHENLCSNIQNDSCYKLQSEVEKYNQNKNINICTNVNIMDTENEKERSKKIINNENNFFQSNIKLPSSVTTFTPSSYSENAAFPLKNSHSINSLLYYNKKKKLSTHCCNSINDNNQGENFYFPGCNNNYDKENNKINVCLSSYASSFSSANNGSVHDSNSKNDFYSNIKQNNILNLNTYASFSSSLQSSFSTYSSSSSSDDKIQSFFSPSSSFSSSPHLLYSSPSVCTYATTSPTYEPRDFNSTFNPNLINANNDINNNALNNNVSIVSNNNTNNDIKNVKSNNNNVVDKGSLDFKVKISTEINASSGSILYPADVPWPYDPLQNNDISSSSSCFPAFMESNFGNSNDEDDTESNIVESNSKVTKDDNNTAIMCVNNIDTYLSCSERKRTLKQMLKRESSESKMSACFPSLKQENRNYNGSINVSKLNNDDMCKIQKKEELVTIKSLIEKADTLSPDLDEVLSALVCSSEGLNVNKSKQLPIVHNRNFNPVTKKIRVVDSCCISILPTSYYRCNHDCVVGNSVEEICSVHSDDSIYQASQERFENCLDVNFNCYSCIRSFIDEDHNINVEQDFKKCSFKNISKVDALYNASPNFYNEDKTQLFKYSISDLFDHNFHFENIFHDCIYNRDIYHNTFSSDYYDFLSNHNKLNLIDIKKYIKEEKKTVLDTSGRPYHFSFLSYTRFPNLIHT